MGSPTKEVKRESGEKQHLVQIAKPFYLGKYEVTQGQWEAVVGDKPSLSAKSPGYPYNKTRVLQKNTERVMVVSPTRVTFSSSNYWGLEGMHGNVFEWCQDLKADYPNGKVNDPVNNQKGTSRVIRGGGWKSPPKHLRSAYRNAKAPSHKNQTIGFRLVLDYD